ncbi:MAG: TonB-dependent receptor plug domain-containing protein, partial [Nitrospirales bacterium]
MNVEVTSVSKKKQKLSGAAAAIFVITQDDIRRSGVTSIPDALRMVPGVQVARLDSNKWAVSARGFNSRFSNKMLVLIDGRNLYNSFFAGTIWEAADTILEDIERIEVIRGPGGTLWGVNAVNGVINIITKHAKDTQGGLVSTLGGTEEAIGGVRYGGTFGQDLHYRIFAKGFNRDTYFNQVGAHDDWRMLRGGFRTDWDMDTQNTFMTEGALYDGDAGQRVTLPTLVAPSFSRTVDEDIRMTGGHVLFRWGHEISQDSDMEFKFFYDHFQREETAINITIDMLDLDVQHRFALPFNQDIVWGLGYRYWMDDYRTSFAIAPTPQTETFQLFNGFIQDEVSLLEDTIKITLGSKLSHNDFTGWEVQPNGRVLWQPVSEHAWWVAGSRAVRVPSRAADSGALVLPPNPPTLTVPVRITGNQRLGPESLVAFEAGYRLAPIPEATFDITAFYNLYDNQIGTRRTAVSPIPTFQFTNNKEARTHGVEVAANLQVVKSWQIRGAYTYLNIDVETEAGALGLPDTDEQGDPHHQASIRSLISLPYDVELDSWVRYVDALPSRSIPSYWELDLRVGWKPWKDVEISLVGQNLLDTHHPEMASSFLITQANEVQRSMYGKVTWGF